MSLLEASGHSSGSPLTKLHLENMHLFPQHPKHHPRGELVPLVPNMKCMDDSPSQKHQWVWEEFMSARLELRVSLQERPELISHQLRPQLHFSQGLEGQRGLLWCQCTAVLSKQPCRKMHRDSTFHLWTLQISQQHNGYTIRVAQEAHHLRDHSAQIREEWMDLCDWGVDFSDGYPSKVFFNKARGSISRTTSMRQQAHPIYYWFDNK